MRAYQKTNSKRAEGVRFVIITMILLTITTFSITSTAMCHSKKDNPCDTKYLREVENKYIKKVKEALTEQGFSKCGITMTRITEEDNTKEYTVLIHHKRISKMNETEKQKLVTLLSEISFPETESRFSHEFLVPEME